MTTLPNQPSAILTKEKMLRRLETHLGTEPSFDQVSVSTERRVSAILSALQTDAEINAQLKLNESAGTLSARKALADDPQLAAQCYDPTYGSATIDLFYLKRSEVVSMYFVSFFNLGFLAIFKPYF